MTISLRALLPDPTAGADSPYLTISLGLLIAGAGLLVVGAWVLGSVALVALGAGAWLVALVAYALSLDPISGDASVQEATVTAAQRNTSALLEELGARGKAIYLPAAFTGVGPRTLVPLSPDAEGALAHPLPNRLIVEYDQARQATGLLLITPGAELAARVPQPSDLPLGELEHELQATLSEVLSLPGRITVTTDADETFSITLTGGPRIGGGHVAGDAVVGSPLASLLAASAAQLLGGPLQLENETTQGDSVRVWLRPR